MAHALQINQIAQEDGLAASLIRPRKEIPPPSASQQTDRREVDSGLDPAPGAVDRPAGPRDVDMDDLTAKMTELQSSLAFVPRGVRKKEAARTKDMVAD